MQWFVTATAGYGPGGTSAKTILHYAQIINSEKFQYFDYDQEKNSKIYHSETPPVYDVTDFTLPVAFIYAQNDWFTNPKVIKKTIFHLNVIIIQWF